MGTLWGTCCRECWNALVILFLGGACKGWLEGGIPDSGQVVLIKAHINMVPTVELEGFRLPSRGYSQQPEKPFGDQKSGGASECSVACSPSD